MCTRTFEVGFDSGKMSGCLLRAAMAFRTASLNAWGMVETPEERKSFANERWRDAGWDGEQK